MSIVIDNKCNKNEAIDLTVGFKLRPTNYFKCISLQNVINCCRILINNFRTGFEVFCFNYL